MCLWCVTQQDNCLFLCPRSMCLRCGSDEELRLHPLAFATLSCIVYTTEKRISCRHLPTPSQPQLKIINQRIAYLTRLGITIWAVCWRTDTIPKIKQKINEEKDKRKKKERVGMVREKTRLKCERRIIKKRENYITFSLSKTLDNFRTPRKRQCLEQCGRVAKIQQSAAIRSSEQSNRSARVNSRNIL